MLVGTDKSPVIRIEKASKGRKQNLEKAQKFVTESKRGREWALRGFEGRRCRNRIREEGKSLGIVVKANGTRLKG